MINSEVILKNMVDPMIVTDPWGTILFYNSATAFFENCGAGTFREGINIIEVCLPAYREPTAEIIRYVRERHESRELEVEMTQPDGHAVYLKITFNPVILQDQTVSVICLTCRDITVQKIFEHKATEIAHTLTEVTENANAVIFSVDTQHYITSWNLECVRLTGFKRHEILAKPMRYFIKEEYLDKFRTAHREVLDGKAVRNLEVEMYTLREDTITLMLSATPRKSREGKVIGILFVGQDITELSEYREDLERKIEDRTQKLQDALRKEKQLVEIKKRFVSIASHEFRVPLGAIHSTVQHLERSARLVQDEREQLRGIDRQVNHMRSLLEDVLTLEKTGLPQLTAESTQVDLVRIVDNIASEVASAHKHSHTVVRDFPDENIVIQADEKLLRNIFLNLISNAIKFSPGKKAIYLSMTVLPNRITVTVRDEGIGILPEDRQRIFEAFNRGSNTGSIPGTGLGLSIVKRAAEALGASVDLEGEPGTGTSISVHFPRPAT